MIASHSAELGVAVRGALDSAIQSGESQWVALQVEVAPGDLLASFDVFEARERFYWERPAQARSIATFGCAVAIETEGEIRFAEASMRAERVFSRLHLAGNPAPAAAGPFLVGGFSFANAASTQARWRGFARSRLVLPEVAISCADGRSWCSAVRSVGAGDDPGKIAEDLHARLEPARRSRGHRTRIDASMAPIAEAPADYRATADRSHGEYRALVEAALREIEIGGFEKVVLARSIALRQQQDYDPCALLERLRGDHPTCAIFAVANPDGAFVGATPECLVRISDGKVETASVAGSAPRGRSPEEDRAFGRRLRESKKEQAEHAIVVRALCDALSPYCDELEVRESPRLMRLPDIQHLETPIAGRLRARTAILELLGSLHPTPAIAGAPREAALEWLARHEKLDRGWYGGPIGFADSDGGGEFYAALRSAVLRGNEAHLFAGAGIVGGSDPEAELRETRLKLRAMLGPLLEV